MVHLSMNCDEKLILQRTSDYWLALVYWGVEVMPYEISRQQTKARKGKRKGMFSACFSNYN